ncbi:MULTISPECIES: OpgC domain-containing protein [Gordonia]|uniref:OpgC domain-containing protein n=1 Tax=Gordonia tangerina TaxID=2911060 RepID=A0ABS9DMU1_9ACTN|nr:OpgC domain-containing protein [Gordonia tangerina]MCF3940406.1 OpgC domain-containing protein [Gordonia tangerina]
MNRDLAIDATRGLAIWSMISLHFAAGTRIAAPTHIYPYVDGMSAFVLLSGLVLGLVYRRWIERHSLGFAYRRLARRIVVLYLCQLTIALTAVAAGMAGHRWLTLLLPVDDWWHGLELAITMRYLPSGGNILLLYMLLMASAYLLFPLLMRNRWQLILAGSVLAYAISLVWSPHWFYVTSFTAGHRIQNWAAWQIMFVPAVVVGWKWREWDVAGFVDRHLAPIIVVAVGFALVLHLGVDAGPWIRFEPTLADKLDFRPARAVGAWLAVPAVYGIFRLLLRHWHRDWVRPLVMTGTRSLDSYVLQALALVVLPIHIAHRPWNTATSLCVVVLVFGLCWAWAEFRQEFGIDKLHRLPMVVRDRLWAARKPTAPIQIPEPSSPATVTPDH